jgi:hypothetical protein
MSGSGVLGVASDSTEMRTAPGSAQMPSCLPE